MANSPQYGHRLIPQIVDSLAVDDPERIVYSIAKSSDISQGFQPVSARGFANAVDKTAWWLREHIGPSASVQTVGYIGPHDLRHILLTYACVKAGSAALFLSPKNSTEAALAVLEAADCHVWVKPREQAVLPLVQDFLQQRPMKILEIPELDELLDAATVKPFPYEKTFQEAINDPFCLLHTSGSTGLPKPISWSHGLIGTMDAVRLLPPTKGDLDLAPWTEDWRDGDSIYSSFPMSHVGILCCILLTQGAGIIMDIILPALFRLHCVMGPAGVIPNMNLVDSLADYAEIDIWSMVPSLVDELGETPDVLTKFKSSKFICASGVSASKVNKIIRVLNLTGTTEGLFIGNLVVEREDWLYFAFHPYSGFEFKEVEPGVFEHWVHRNEQWPLFQGIFHTFPDQSSINLKDLYVKHPNKPDLWAYKGRNDDIVVLSIGYKISPLDTEALVTTHPAIVGCLMIGTGKPQAGLLIELKDPTSGNTELFDSIWATVEHANSLSLHIDQLQRDYITFAELDKPFVRTDKGTIKRRATMLLYADYIERFYRSRLEEPDERLAHTIDVTSLDAVTDAVRTTFGALLPKLKDVPLDQDVFRLGIDSLLVYRAIKSLRAATGLHDALSPRHLYAYPTLAKFSAAVADLGAAAARNVNGKPNGTSGLADAATAKMDALRSRYRAQLSHKVNSFDLMNPNIYVGMNFFFPLRKGASFEKAFERLQDGLRRTMELIPVLEGKIMACSEQEMGYKRGDLRVTLPPVPSTATDETTSSSDLKQLKYKDLSSVLPPYRELKAGSFLTSSFRDSLVLDAPWFPPLPADIMIAQANFVDGGCILATNFHHACFDGMGVMAVMRAWAESCRLVQGDAAATCAWLDDDCLDRSLPHVLYEHEGYARPASEIDPAVWGFLGFADPSEQLDGDGVPVKSASAVTNGTNGAGPHAAALPPAPVFPRKFAWPPLPPTDGRRLRATTFVISPENVQRLVDAVVADPAAGGAISSVNDIVQAFFWRAAIKARHRVATQCGQVFAPADVSIAEFPIDARPYFSARLPATYMGSLLVTSRPTMAVEELVAPDTSVARVALQIREAAARITPALVHDAFGLLQAVPDYSMLTNACMGLAGMHAMINNLVLFSTAELQFGNEFFGQGGAPDAMRVQMDRFMTAFRLLVILPQRKDGGVELLLGTLPEELAELLGDDEFTGYASLLGQGAAWEGEDQWRI